MFTRHTLAPLTALLVLVITLLVPVDQVSARHAGPQHPTYCCASLLITPHTVVIGQIVHIVGGGFFPGEVVNLYIDAPQPPAPYRVQADAYGIVNVYRSIPIPFDGLYEQPRSLIAIGQFSNQSAQTSFTIRPTIKLSPTAGPPGTIVHVSGNGFYYLDDIVVFLGMEIVGQVETSAPGIISGSFTVPYTAAVGKYTVLAYGGVSEGTATAHFNVLGK